MLIAIENECCWAVQTPAMLVDDDFVIYTCTCTCLSLGRRGAVCVLSPLYREPLPRGKPCEPSSRLPNKDTGTVWRQGPRGEREKENIVFSRPLHGHGHF